MIIAEKLAAYTKEEKEQINNTIREIEAEGAAKAEKLGVPIERMLFNGTYTDIGWKDDGKGGRKFGPISIQMPKRLIASTATRALDSIYLMHEVAEAEALKKKNILPIHSHAHPSVLLTEAEMINRFPQKIRDRAISDRSKDMSFVNAYTVKRDLGAKVKEEDLPALEKAILAKMRSGEGTKGSINKAYRDTKGQRRSLLYESYISDMLRRAAEIDDANNEYNMYNKLNSLLHPSLRYDPEAEKDTAKGIYAKAKKKGLIGGGIGAASGAAVTLPYLVLGRNGESLASFLGATIIGGLVGAGVGHDMAVSKGIREKYYDDGATKTAASMGKITAPLKTYASRLTGSNIKQVERYYRASIDRLSGRALDLATKIDDADRFARRGLDLQRKIVQANNGKAVKDAVMDAVSRGGDARIPHMGQITKIVNKANTKYDDLSRLSSKTYTAMANRVDSMDRDMRKAVIDSQRARIYTLAGAALALGGVAALKQNAHNPEETQ
jgi:hypothetical protein